MTTSTLKKFGFSFKNRLGSALGKSGKKVRSGKSVKVIYKTSTSDKLSASVTEAAIPVEAKLEQVSPAENLAVNKLDQIIIKVPPVTVPSAVVPEVRASFLRGREAEEARADKVLKELAQGSKMSIIRFIDHLVDFGQELRASDIHFDPENDLVRVRLRIDGVLQEFFQIPKELHEGVISRIKILSGLRTDEHQSAQDGRFRCVLEGEIRVDVRVSIVPTYYGENAVFRLLSDKAEEYTLKSLGFSVENQKKILHAIKKPYGMILATGPTGSGKTTTLYTLVKMLNTRESSIITIEDPIEYSIAGINQIQVNPRTGLSFANGLKSVLRQDPNIIMVGEIRDVDTAGIAVNTALTGHLLLSTLHTNDAATTLPRLLDMKVEPYLISSTVNIAIGQRLVRRICENCKTAEQITASEIKSLSDIIPTEAFLSHKVFYSGKGCELCNNTGYQGRIGIHEVMVMETHIREAILQKASASDIRKIAILGGMTPMIQDGFEKAAAGLTTIQEVLRMLYE